MASTFKHKEKNIKVRTTVNGKNFFQVQNQPVDIAPILIINRLSGCMVVDVVVDVDLTQRLRAALFVSEGQKSSYTPTDLQNCWLVDLPEGDFWDKFSIYEAIAAFEGGAGSKPPKPPPW